MFRYSVKSVLKYFIWDIFDVYLNIWNIHLHYFVLRYVRYRELIDNGALISICCSKKGENSLGVHQAFSPFCLLVQDFLFHFIPITLIIRAWKVKETQNGR